ncbi:MAG: DUF4236 domain-containing protein [Pseudonocardia sp.]|nr:DUF4236 domain-containing protein [Pseudonocardia sp.]
MPIYVRKRFRLWPLPVFLNFSRSGVSWSVEIGAWSWNSRQRRQRVNLPGPLYYVGRRRRPHRRREP